LVVKITEKFLIVLLLANVYLALHNL
jgi:hypothetical protein